MGHYDEDMGRGMLQFPDRKWKKSTEKERRYQRQMYRATLEWGAAEYAAYREDAERAGPTKAEKAAKIAARAEEARQWIADRLEMNRKLADPKRKKYYWTRLRPILPVRVVGPPVDLDDDIQW